jgi:acyl-CoA thioester hydrolase
MTCITYANFNKWYHLRSHLILSLQHMNNPVYGVIFDSIINDYLIKHCGRRPMNPQTKENGIVVTSHCDFFGSVQYPDMIDACMRVNKLGKTSVEYEVGIFQQGFEDVRAVGGFMHVFCDQDTGRPMPGGMSEGIRKGLEAISVEHESGEKGKL